MGWSIGYDDGWQRDIGYGVPAVCDYPDCSKEIYRGLAHVCGGDAWGGEYGCGLFFCSAHLVFAGKKRDHVRLCTRCRCERDSYNAKPDVLEWVKHKLTDPSWAEWREENKEQVAALHQRVKETVE